jgi:hypothetical protein
MAIDISNRFITVAYENFSKGQRKFDPAAAVALFSFLERAKKSPEEYARASAVLQDDQKIEKYIESVREQLEEKGVLKQDNTLIQEMFNYQIMLIQEMSDYMKKSDAKYTGLLIDLKKNHAASMSSLTEEHATGMAELGKQYAANTLILNNKLDAAEKARTAAEKKSEDLEREHKNDELKRKKEGDRQFFINLAIGIIGVIGGATIVGWIIQLGPVAAVISGVLAVGVGAIGYRYKIKSDSKNETAVTEILQSPMHEQKGVDAPASVNASAPDVATRVSPTPAVPSTIAEKTHSEIPASSNDNPSAEGCTRPDKKRPPKPSADDKLRHG